MTPYVSISVVNILETRWYDKGDNISNSHRKQSFNTKAFFQDKIVEHAIKRSIEHPYAETSINFRSNVL